jgi:hypothetical protein
MTQTLEALVTVPSSPDGLLMMIEQNDEKHSTAHLAALMDAAVA